jgi:hypothetical protein
MLGMPRRGGSTHADVEISRLADVLIRGLGD